MLFVFNAAPRILPQDKWKLFPNMSCSFFFSPGLCGSERGRSQLDQGVGICLFMRSVLKLTQAPAATVEAAVKVSRPAPVVQRSRSVQTTSG